MDFSGKKIALAITGSIAAYRACDLVRELYRSGAKAVTCLMTDAAQRFISPLSLEALSKQPVLVDTLGTSQHGIPDHIWLAQDYDALLIYPVTANTLAKLAGGLADDIVTTTAITFTGKPVLLAPAMNTRMWTHPLTLKNLSTLTALDNVTLIAPMAGELACGEVGDGHLAEQDTVLHTLYKAVHPHRNLLAGQTILVTAGGTQEPLDPVRQLTNRSSGKMGVALADEAYAMGANVILLAAETVAIPNLEQRPYPIHRFRTVDDLRTQLNQTFPQADLTYMAAAVSDFKPATYAEHKIKRNQTLALALAPTEDLISHLALKRQPHQRLIGFAAESQHWLENATSKMHRKGLDAIVVNDISRTDIGFESTQNEVTVLLTDGTQHPLTKARKSKIAQDILQLTSPLVSQTVNSPAEAII